MQVDLEALKSEQAKREAALREVSDQVSRIEAAELVKREEQERREREFADLKAKLDQCRQWIGFTERKIDELRELAEGLADVSCAGRGDGETFSRLRETSQELLVWERVFEILRERRATYESRLQAMEEAK